MSNKTDDTEIYVYAWLIVTAVILIPALLLGGGPGWIFGAPILAAVSMLVGNSGNNNDNDNDDDDNDSGPRRKSSIGKTVLIGGGAAAAGYALGKKLEL